LPPGDNTLAVDNWDDRNPAGKEVAMPGPTLVVMAAGIGSRYGGLKQIDPVGPSGEIIIDYSVYDALRAGFGRVVFVIRRDIERDFRAKIGRNVESRTEVEYVFQDLADLPPGFTVPPNREKPWGTGHAVRAAREFLDGNFAVINADDFYGAGSYRVLCEYLGTAADSGGVGDYCLVGYVLWNTLSDHGHVARGVCSADSGGFLTEIHERTHLRKFGEAARFSEDRGRSWTEVPRDSLVSMNMWGFTPGFVAALEERFGPWLEKHAAEPKAEFYVPVEVGGMIAEGSARVRVLPTDEKWFGVTYRQDAPEVKAAVTGLVERGVYPADLWAGA
jgi:hypothetical protein